MVKAKTISSLFERLLVQKNTDLLSSLQRPLVLDPAIICGYRQIVERRSSLRSRKTASQIGSMLSTVAELCSYAGLDFDAIRLAYESGNSGGLTAIVDNSAFPCNVQSKKDLIFIFASVFDMAQHSRAKAL